MTPRPSLPASSSDFALPPTTSSASSSHASTSSAPFPSPSDEVNPLILRFRRPSLLAPARTGFNPESHLQSPLAMSFSLPLSRRYSTSITMDASGGEESESDKDKMWTDSPPSVDSGSITPALSDPASTYSEKSTLSVDSDASMKSRPRSPSTPPPRVVTKSDVSVEIPSTAKVRRLSHPIKMPRILTLLAEEARPEESEVKSEAQFQRFFASSSEFPLQPRTPRAASDRGRFPEEVETEEPSHEEASSDDDDEAEAPFAYTSSEPINIAKPVTPAQSVNGDEFNFGESPGGVAMDIDMPSSSYGSPNLGSWRYTPPPTSSAVRSNKRKFDDRYDPYPTANKRRAVSPSLSYLRENQPSLFNPRTPNGTPRVPMPLPISIPNGYNSGASSPIISSNGSGLASTRPMSLGSASAMSSPTLRAQIGLASPVLRPMIRARREGEGREVDGAGEAVNGLSLE